VVYQSDDAADLLEPGVREDLTEPHVPGRARPGDRERNACSVVTSQDHHLSFHQRNGDTHRGGAPAHLAGTQAVFAASNKRGT
jgi:hypothetical protein